MQHRTSPELTRRARELRKTKTPAEELLWQHLRAKRFASSKWRQQYPVNGYICDFYCAKARLVIELDGSQHDLEEGRAYDAIRTELLGTRRLRVLRFKNAGVLSDIETVLRAIEAQLP